MIKNRYADFTQNRTRVFLIFFLGLILYNYIVVNNFSIIKVDIITYTYHIVDFSIGFCTKLLPGEIFSFIFKDVLPWQVTLVETVLLFIVFALVAYVLADLVCSQNNAEGRKTIMLLSLFMLTGPVTFSTFVQELGMLDVYWIYFSVLFLLFISKKKLYFLIPLVYVLSASIHFSAFISYILLFSIIILYKISKEKENRRQLIAVLLISVLLSLILMIIFMKNESDNVLLNIDEFHKYIDARDKFKGEDSYYTYYDYALYKVPYLSNYPVENMANDFLIKKSAVLPEFIVDIINAFWQQIHIVYCCYLENPKDILDLIFALALLLPVALFLIRFWLNKIRENKSSNKFPAFIFFIILVQLPFTAIMGCLCSPDYIRWLTHSFGIQFILIIYIIFNEKGTSTEWVSDYFSRYDKKILFFYWMVYSITLLRVY